MVSFPSYTVKLIVAVGNLTKASSCRHKRSFPYLLPIRLSLDSPTYFQVIVSMCSRWLKRAINTAILYRPSTCLGNCFHVVRFAGWRFNFLHSPSAAREDKDQSRNQFGKLRSRFVQFCLFAWQRSKRKCLNLICLLSQRCCWNVDAAILFIRWVFNKGLKSHQSCSTLQFNTVSAFFLQKRRLPESSRFDSQNFILSRSQCHCFELKAFERFFKRNIRRSSLSSEFSEIFNDKALNTQSLATWFSLRVLSFDFGPKPHW